MSVKILSSYLWKEIENFLSKEEILMYKEQDPGKNFLLRRLKIELKRKSENTKLKKIIFSIENDWTYNKYTARTIISLKY